MQVIKKPERSSGFFYYPVRREPHGECSFCILRSEICIYLYSPHLPLRMELMVEEMRLTQCLESEQ